MAWSTLAVGQVLHVVSHMGGAFDVCPGGRRSFLFLVGGGLPLFPEIWAIHHLQFCLAGSVGGVKRPDPH